MSGMVLEVYERARKLYEKRFPGGTLPSEFVYSERTGNTLRLGGKAGMVAEFRISKGKDGGIRLSFVGGYDTRQRWPWVSAR